MQKRIDLIFCLIVLPVVIAIFPVERWVQNFPLYTISVLAWLYLLYFINRRIVVPRIIKTDGKDVLSWVIIVASIAITGMLASVELFQHDYGQFDEGLFTFLPRLKMYQQAIICWCMVVETFSFFIGYLQETYQQKIARKELEAIRDKEILRQLRNRIRPHFMFNTLNSLYGLFLTENPVALPSLAKYISMLQYIHKASDTSMVPLADEIQYIREYIDLQTLRLNGKTKVEFLADVENDYRLFPPLLLVTFVENCFKYGVSSIDEGLIKITLTGEDDLLTFTTFNRIFSKGDNSGRNGLENCKKRLEFGFPGLYNLNITNDGEFYSVNLSIKYKEQC